MMKEESNYQELLIILLCQRYTQIIFHGEKIKYRLVTKSTAETTSLFTSSPQWSLHWIFFWRIFSSIMSFLAMHKMFCGLEGNTKIKCFQKYQNVTFTSKKRFEHNFYRGLVKIHLLDMVPQVQLLRLMRCVYFLSTSSMTKYIYFYQFGKYDCCFNLWTINTNALLLCDDKLLVIGSCSSLLVHLLPLYIGVVIGSGQSSGFFICRNI